MSHPDDVSATWRCNGCGSVCEGDPLVTPSPCDFCGSTDIEQVSSSVDVRGS